jgi:hypothetical protein
VSAIGNFAGALEREVGGLGRSVSQDPFDSGGESGEKGRREISVIVSSPYLGLDGGRNGALLAAWSGVPRRLSALIAMLSLSRVRLLGAVLLCAITILYEMVSKRTVAAGEQKAVPRRRLRAGRRGG